MYPVTNNISYDNGCTDEDYRGRRGTNWDISEQLENWILLMMYAFHTFVNMEKMVRDLQGKRSIGRLLINSEGTKSLKIITRNERRFEMNENYTEKVNSAIPGQCGDQTWWDSKV
jgi:hypothetical protein